ncbi:Hpt domain-containing protein [Shewanella sp. MEBiC00475]|uniref:Hpt domain-containing protein n=1 Tax=Shewanella sp. MEBiC00475 TaxID=2575361 RepID=UPI0010C1353D|nr:Hpt domain-containing protein [Shewanella sp. MEBiC00475]
MKANKMVANLQQVDESNNKVANNVSSDLENMTLASLLEPFGGNEIFYRRLIRVFEKNLEPQLQNIDLMISQKNIKELLRLVHTLKGSSGTTGLSSLYQYLCNLESKLAGLDTANEVDILNSVLGQELRLVAQAELSSIHALLAKDDVNKLTETSSAADYSVPELTLMLTELKQHLQDHNLKALHITLSLQNKLLGHAHLEPDLTKLCDAVEMLDFETALAALSSLSKKW